MSIRSPEIREVPPGARKFAPKLRWFLRHANPAAPWKEATKSGRTVNELSLALVPMGTGEFPGKGEEPPEPGMETPSNEGRHHRQPHRRVPPFPLQFERNIAHALGTVRIFST